MRLLSCFTLAACGPALLLLLELEGVGEQLSNREESGRSLGVRVADENLHVLIPSAELPDHLAASAARRSAGLVALGENHTNPPDRARA